MNRNTIFGQYNFSPSSGHAGGQKVHAWINREHCFFPPMSNYASIISHLLNQPEADCELDPSFLGSAQKTEMLFQSDGSSTPSRETSFLCQLPASGLSNSSQFHNEHLQAKRARVENIIQGMNIMPQPSEAGAIEKGDQHQGEKMKKSYRENRRKQKLPQQQNPHETSLARSGKSSIQVEECLRLKKQLHLLQCQLEQLENRFLQPSELSNSSQNQGCLEKTMHFLKETLEQSLDNRNQSAVSYHHEDLSWRSVPGVGRSKLSEEETGLVNSHIPTPEEGTLTEILKHELVQEVTQAVDSVLRKVLSKSSGSQSQLSNSPSAIASIGREFLGAGESTPQKWLPKVSSHKGSMSLITNKAPGFPACSIHSKQERKPCQVPHVNYPLIMSSEPQGKGVLSQMLLCDQNGHWGSLPPRIPSPESTDMPWQPSKLKSSVVRPQRYVKSYKSADMESAIPFSSSDTEFAEMHAVMAGMPFPSTHVQEALTPGHLKKAKLMFFFSRYPTSSLLKAYFLDVQFTRCITSQLIKWFSNFREFYYIQMEKFARQAILEGITDPNNLIVSRNSELFRILNIHYNKGNDFEVPEGFLNVANLTLQEFFNALQAGKDLDPSWKKPIYKIISKLDSEIPDAFKSSGCLQELTHC